jgi:glycosyltransferase involved in cell wall biosynthesis
VTIARGPDSADAADAENAQSGQPRTVLMVMYFFPPIGGVSMSRNVRNVQYLPRYGWTPVVLTPRNGAYELTDPQAMKSVPAGLAIIRSRSLEPGHLRPLVIALRTLRRKRPGRRPIGHVAPAGHPGPIAPHDAGDASASPPRVSVLVRLRQLLFFPDEQVGWLPFALTAALRSGRSAKFDVVFSTSSPITAHVIAGLFARLTGTPWVAEFRDPWLGNALAARLPWFHRRLQAKLERWIVGSADRIVCVTPSLTRLYRDRYPAASIVTITNGYDRSEVVVDRTEREEPSPFRIVYTGTLYRPAELEVFLGGVAALLSRRPDLQDRLEIAFYGQVTNDCQAVADRLVAGSALNTVVRFLGFVPRQVALRAVADADAALVLLGGGPGMGLFVGGKVYDYLGQSKQILAMIPPGDARDMLEGLSWGVIADPDPEDVGRAIERLVGMPAPDGPADPAGKYDREVLAGRLADTLAEAFEGRPSSQPAS